MGANGSACNCDTRYQRKREINAYDQSLHTSRRSRNSNTYTTRNQSIEPAKMAYSIEDSNWNSPKIDPLQDPVYAWAANSNSNITEEYIDDLGVSISPKTLEPLHPEYDDESESQISQLSLDPSDTTTMTTTTTPIKQHPIDPKHTSSISISSIITSYIGNNRVVIPLPVSEQNEKNGGINHLQNSMDVDIDIDVDTILDNIE